MKLPAWSIEVLVVIVLTVCKSLDSTSGSMQLLTENDVEEIVSTCDSQRNTIHVNKEEYDEVGSVIRSCSGDLTVTKCEGTCASQVQPSVVTPTGFLKSCHCCRETWMAQKETRLTECYDSNGQRLFGDQGMMTVFVKEPENCSCYKCD